MTTKIKPGDVVIAPLLTTSPLLVQSTPDKILYITIDDEQIFVTPDGKLQNDSIESIFVINSNSSPEKINHDF